MTEPSAFDDSRVPPYVRVTASELAAAVAGQRGRTAAVSAAVDLPRSVTGRKVEGWQATVMRYDNDGPGFVGWVSDVKAFLAALIPMVVQERSPEGNWSNTDNPVAVVAANQIRNDQEDTSELIFRWYRMLDTVGELWCVLGSSSEGGISVDLASINQVEWMPGGSGEAVILTRPDQTRQSLDARHVPAELMLRSWRRRSDWPDLPTSQWRRAIPDVERYRATTRNITRVLNSRLVTNGILHFHVASGQPIVNPDTPGAAIPVPKIIQDYAVMTGRAIRNDDDEAAFAPFPIWGEQAPEWIEVGRLLDPMALEAEVAALKAVGRDINFPLQLLVDGPGAGNHWSDVFLNEQFLSQDVAGTLEAVLHDMTIGPYRRILTALWAAMGETDGDVRNYRLWYDLSALAKRPDDTRTVVDLYLNGLISDKAARARLRIPESDAPPVVEAPPPQAAPGTGDASNLLPGAPSAGPPQTAAVRTIPRADLGKVTADLNTIDASLFLTLDGVAQRTVKAILIRCGQELLAALPDSDPDKARLAVLPPEQVWAAAPAQDRALVQTRPIVEEFVRPAQEQAEEEMHKAIIAIGLVFAANQLMAPPALQANVPDAGAQFGLGTGAAANQTLSSPPLRPTAPVPRWAPTAVSRTAMNVAAGAVLTTDPDGLPQLPDGTWEGGSGPATGPDAIEALRLEFTDLELSYRWDHGDPKHPFPPHLALNGQTYTNENRFDTLANLDDNGVPREWPSPIYHPGDHVGCTCNEEIILTTTLRSQEP